MAKRFSTIKTGLLVALFLVLTGCFSEAEWHEVRLSGETMGTTYHVTIVVRDPFDPTDLAAEIDRRLVGVNQAMSTYVKDSELNLLNAAPVDSPISLSSELAELLRLARQISLDSGGYYDVTIGPLVNLWGFGPSDQGEAVPSQDQIDQARAKVGTDKFILSNLELTKLAPIYIDLSSIAKGYGVDLIRDYLIEAGYPNVLVEIGGEIATNGHNSRSTQWVVGIENPQSLAQSAIGRVKLSTGAVATSGDYRNFFYAGEKRYGHTIDPYTGYPISHNTLSVTVLADDCATADGWSTALNSAGVELGFEMAEQNGIAAYFIFVEKGEFAVKYTSAFTAQQEM